MDAAASPPARLWAMLVALASVSRLHIVAIGSSGALTFGWIFTGRYLWLAAGVCAFDWFVVNLLNRVVDLPEDRLNAIPATGFVGRHQRIILAAGFGLLGLSLGLVHIAAPAVTPLRLCGHALALGYNWPLLPGRRRLKQIYFFKNTASATGFLLTVFGYPLVEATGWRWQHAALCADIMPATIALAAAFFFLFEVSYEIVYDLRDAPGDARAGVRSYPVVHGERGAVRIIDSLLAASVAVLLVGYGLGQVPWRLFIMFAAPLVQFALYKRMLRRGIGAGDCIRLTWVGVGLLATYHVWVLFDLPGARI
ncbi:MAG: UbiA family prenyltransferase [Deltaproteobacteria bacterium]|nr:UbiA family prenyltransferase [Deltaproteobacteria bacterium]